MYRGVAPSGCSYTRPQHKQKQKRSRHRRTTTRTLWTGGTGLLHIAHGTECSNCMVHASAQPVLVLRTLAKSTSAPAPNNSRTHSTRPNSLAINSGVVPSACVVCAFQTSTGGSTALPGWSLITGRCSSQPKLTLAWLTAAPPLRRTWTHCTWPFSLAKYSGGSTGGCPGTLVEGNCSHHQHKTWREQLFTDPSRRPATRCERVRATHRGPWCCCAMC